MPIYEFQCGQCEKVVERWQRFNDPYPEKCEFCGGRLHKIMSKNTFHLKGSGWYVTDYCRKDSGSDKDSSKSSSSTCSENKCASSQSSTQTSASAA